jgi:CheY-like chemotaxis protein
MQYFSSKTNNALRILIIEDDEDYRELIAKNFEVVFPDAVIDCATSYADAAERIKHGNYHRIYLDGSLHDGWGRQVQYFVGSYGWEVMMFIHEHSKTSDVFGISNEDRYNQRMAEGGAKACYPKEVVLGDRLKEVFAA